MFNIIIAIFKKTKATIEEKKNWPRVYLKRSPMSKFRNPGDTVNFIPLSSKKGGDSSRCRSSPWRILLVLATLVYFTEAIP